MKSGRSLNTSYPIYHYRLNNNVGVFEWPMYIQPAVCRTTLSFEMTIIIVLIEFANNQIPAHMFYSIKCRTIFFFTNTHPRGKTFSRLSFHQKINIGDWNLGILTRIYHYRPFVMWLFHYKKWHSFKRAIILKNRLIK